MKTIRPTQCRTSPRKNWKDSGQHFNKRCFRTINDFLKQKDFKCHCLVHIPFKSTLFLANLCESKQLLTPPYTLRRLIRFEGPSEYIYITVKKMNYPRH